MGFVSFRGYMVAPEMAAALRAVEADSGKVIIVTSGYRSDAEQARLYEEYKAGKRGGPVAKPGYSNHRTGYAVDVSAGSIPIMLKYGPARGLYQLKGDPPHFDLGAKVAANPSLYGISGGMVAGGLVAGPAGAVVGGLLGAGGDLNPFDNMQTYLDTYIVQPFKKAIVPLALIILGLLLMVIYARAQITGRPA